MVEASREHGEQHTELKTIREGIMAVCSMVVRQTGCPMVLTCRRNWGMLDHSDTEYISMGRSLPRIFDRTFLRVLSC